MELEQKQTSIQRHPDPKYSQQEGKAVVTWPLLFLSDSVKQRPVCQTAIASIEKTQAWQDVWKENLARSHTGLFPFTEGHSENLRLNSLPSPTVKAVITNE